MRRLFAVLLVAMSLLSVSDRTLAGETIRIASEGYYPPFNYLDASGKLAGFDIDIGEALCERMQAKCEFSQHAWDDLIPGLLDEKFDVIIASMSITAEREKLVSFTIPYYSNMLTFIGRKNSGIAITDDGLKGKLVGSQRGTISAEYLGGKYDGIVNVQLYDTQEDAYKDLAAGKLDLVLGDNLPSFAWLQTVGGKSYEFVGEFIDINDRIGMAVRKGDDALRQRINQALIEILENGTYQSINEKYFPFNIYF